MAHKKLNLNEKKGLWANIHAKRKRGEKMNPKGHPDAPSSKEMKMAQEAIQRRMDRMVIIATDPATGRKVVKIAPKKEIDIGKGKQESFVNELYPSHNTGTIDMDKHATPAQKKARADHAKKREAFAKKYPNASTSEKMFAKLKSEEVDYDEGTLDLIEQLSPFITEDHIPLLDSLSVEEILNGEFLDEEMVNEIIGAIKQGTKNFFKKNWGKIGLGAGIGTWVANNKWKAGALAGGLGALALGNAMRDRKQKKEMQAAIKANKQSNRGPSLNLRKQTQAPQNRNESIEEAKLDLYFAYEYFMEEYVDMLSDDQLNEQNIDEAAPLLVPLALAGGRIIMQQLAKKGIQKVAQKGAEKVAKNQAKKAATTAVVTNTAKNVAKDKAKKAWWKPTKAGLWRDAKFTAGFEGGRRGLDYLTKGAGDALKKYGPYAAAAGAGALLLNRRKKKKEQHQAKLAQMKSGQQPAKESYVFETDINENIIGASFARGDNQGNFNNEVDAVRDALAQIQELSPQTISSYQKKAGKQYRQAKGERPMHPEYAAGLNAAGKMSDKDMEDSDKAYDTMKKRGKGLAMSKGKGVQQEYAAPSMSAKGKSGGSKGKGMRMSHYKMDGEQRIQEQMEIIEITLKHQKGQPIRNIGRLAAKAAMIAGVGKLGMDAYKAYKAKQLGGPMSISPGTTLPGKSADNKRGFLGAPMTPTAASKAAAKKTSDTVAKAANIASKNANNKFKKRFATMSYELEGETAITEQDYQIIDEAIPVMAAQIAKSMIANKLASKAIQGLGKGAKAAKKGISMVGRTARSGVREGAVNELSGAAVVGKYINPPPAITNIRGGVNRAIKKKFAEPTTTKPFKPTAGMKAEGAFKEIDTKKQEDERLAKKKKDSQYSDKDVRMGKGVAFDKRYKGGNMTGAYKTINKIKKGLGDHPKVADALRRANEQFNNEGERNG